MTSVALAWSVISYARAAFWFLRAQPRFTCHSELFTVIMLSEPFISYHFDRSQESQIAEEELKVWLKIQALLQFM